MIDEESVRLIISLSVLKRAVNLALYQLKLTLISLWKVEMLITHDYQRIW